MSERLRLKAADAEDLAVIAACLQDARLTQGEMVFQADEQRFLAAFVRYRRERQADPISCEGLTEIGAALVFDGIVEVKYRGLDPSRPERQLELLTIATEPGKKAMIHIDLVFAGDTVVQLRTDAIACRLEDFGKPEICRVTPCDHFAADFWAKVEHGAVS